MTKHILYLASGNSKRFGENKLVYNLCGKPLFLYGLEMLQQLTVSRDDCSLTVVSRFDSIRQTAASMGIPSIDSPESEKGISYTIKAGLDYLLHATDIAIGDNDYLLFVVADQPFLTAASVEQLLHCAKQGVETASMSYQGIPGNPTLFHAKLIQELMALEGDVGGRSVLRNHDCVYVEVQNQKELRDIDILKDLDTV